MTQEDKQRLESFSTEELKAEIKRRAEIARAKKGGISMAEYIDKVAVIAEIERRLKALANT